MPLASAALEVYFCTKALKAKSKGMKMCSSGSGQWLCMYPIPLVTNEEGKT